MYKISIIVCVVFLIIFIGTIMWQNNEEKQLAQLEEATANFLRVERRQKPMIIEMVNGEEDEILILSYEKALELKRKFPVGNYTYFFKDMPWPIMQSFTIEKFIEWLYFNDYEIVKKEAE